MLVLFFVSAVRYLSNRVVVVAAGFKTSPLSGGSPVGFVLFVLL